MSVAKLPFVSGALCAALLAAASGCLVHRFEHLGITDAAARAELAASTIVFAQREGLYLSRGDGSHATRLLASAEVGRGGAVFLPALDAAGRRVLFLSIVDLDVKESTGRDLALNILTLDGPASPGATVTAWRRALLGKLAPPEPDGRQQIFAVAGAAWSDDAERIALGLARPAGAPGDALVLFDAAGAPLAEYTLQGRRLGRVSSLSWAKDGRAIILGLSGAEGMEGIVARLELPGAGRTGATLVDLAPGRFPSLSPDGLRIAVVDDRGGPDDVVLLSPDGKEAARFERPAGRALNRPFWSPSGRYLYYYSLASTGPLGLLDVTTLRCLDTRTRQVFDLIRLT